MIDGEDVMHHNALDASETAVIAAPSGEQPGAKHRVGNYVDPLPEC
jgi:hypothetical protein